MRFHPPWSEMRCYDGGTLAQLKPVIVAASVLMVAVFVVPLLQWRWVSAARDDLARAERQRDAVQDVVTWLAQAESAARGLIVTGRSGLIERYYRARGDLKTAVNEIDAAAADDPALGPRWRDAVSAVQARLTALESQVSARQTRGTADGAEAMRRGESDRDLDTTDAALAQVAALTRRRASAAAGYLARVTTLTAAAASVIQLVCAALLLVS